MLFNLKVTSNNLLKELMEKLFADKDYISESLFNGYSLMEYP